MIQAPHPCLWFDGNAQEAADFYCTIFPDSKVNTHNSMVNEWEIMGLKIMGLNAGPMFKINPGISLTVTFPIVEEVNTAFAKLLEGGSSLMAIGAYPWSPRYGWVKDKYGMTWQLTLEETHTIKPSMLFTDLNLGQASKAIDLYTSLFENSSISMKAHYPEGSPHVGFLMYSEFNLQNRKIVAMDGPGGHEYVFNEGVSLVITCDTQAEIDYLWDKLTENGGSESQCGWLKDPFGVSWQIIPRILSQKMNAGDAKRSGQMMQALMGMRKLIINDLEAAYNS
jgi:predicted 3-demethylubiquinone-9 3-methyltransferase (glyoxalase superfamily)